ncbi:flagellar regulator YcgR PilZN domain-containing protein [Cupriavidus basilensis]
MLRDLSWQKCLITVRTRTGHQFVTSILLEMDPVSTSASTGAAPMPSASRYGLGRKRVFRASLLAACRSAARSGRPSATRHDDGPAFVAGFPEKLYHFQRRRHSRAHAGDQGLPLRHPQPGQQRAGPRHHSPTCRCPAWACVPRAVGVDRLPVGTTVSRCRLDFRELGKLDIDLQVVGHWLVGNATTARSITTAAPS